MLNTFIFNGFFYIPKRFKTIGMKTCTKASLEIGIETDPKIYISKIVLMIC